MKRSVSALKTRTKDKYREEAHHFCKKRRMQEEKPSPYLNHGYRRVVILTEISPRHNEETSCLRVSDTHRDITDDNQPLDLGLDLTWTCGTSTASLYQMEKKNTSITPIRPPSPSYNPVTNIFGPCRSIEEFNILEKLGEGSFGTVYRATDKRANGNVALKKMKFKSDRDGVPLSLLREVITMTKVKGHENVISLHEVLVGSLSDDIYLVMDFVDSDLRSHLQCASRPLSEERITDIMKQLLTGVAYLHSHNIFHRDLKPSNLLLGKNHQLKICDFGLARDSSPPEGDLTPIVVTLWYRCPELLLGYKNYGTAIDIWSVGCIFAELYSRKPLFRGKSEIDQLLNIFKIMGTPDETTWSDIETTPIFRACSFEKHTFKRTDFMKLMGRRFYEEGLSLIKGLLDYNPDRRLTAEEALDYKYFKANEKSAYRRDLALFVSDGFSLRF